MRLSEAQDAVITCRTIGHSWDENPSPEVTSYYNRQWLMALRCVRCLTERYDWMNQAGEIIGRWYKYPVYYRTLKAKRMEFRAEMVSRSLLVQRYRNGK